MPRIPSLNVEDIADPEAAELLAQYEEGLGDSLFFGALGHTPTLMKEFLSFYNTFWEDSAIERYLLELMRIRSAVLTECEH